MCTFWRMCLHKHSIVNTLLQTNTESSASSKSKTGINALSLASLFQWNNMQASPGKIPIGARLTWLPKAYFTLYWPTSLHFLPSSVYTHPSIFYFLFQLPYQTAPSAFFFPFFFPVKSLEAFCMSAQIKDRSFFCLLCCVEWLWWNICALSLTLSPRQARSALWNSAALRSENESRCCMTITDVTAQQSAAVSAWSTRQCKLRKHDRFLIMSYVLVPGLKRHEYSHLDTQKHTHTCTCKPMTNLLNLLSGQWIRKKCQGWVSLPVHEEPLMAAIWFQVKTADS